MANIYELVAQYQRLIEAAPYAEPDVFQRELEEIEADIEEKAENYAKVIQCLDADIEKIKEEIDRLSKRRKSLEKNIEKMKKALQGAMVETGKLKFRTALFSFDVQKNPPSVQIKDVAAVPVRFYRQPEPVLDKMALRDYLKQNGAQEYAELVQTESLRIR